MEHVQWHYYFHLQRSKKFPGNKRDVELQIAVPTLHWVVNGSRLHDFLVLWRHQHFPWLPGHILQLGSWVASRATMKWDWRKISAIRQTELRLTIVSIVWARYGEMAKLVRMLVGYEGNCQYYRRFCQLVISSKLHWRKRGIDHKLKVTTWKNHRSWILISLFRS